ncbi:hypothetical protein [Streptomyces umbrinus]|uniref:hypothetical protein n=1 Tax=Streptomyces umbrinus TaxID=67370 RepID=UPI0033C12933
MPHQPEGGTGVVPGVVVEVHEVGSVFLGDLLHDAVEPLLDLVQDRQRILGDIYERQFRLA